MLADFKRGRVKHGLREYLRRTSRRVADRVFFRVRRDTFAASLRCLGLSAGDIVCVHASLSRLGHIVDGADSIIDALMDVVGEDGCVLMPSFSMAGSMEDFVNGEPVFDVRNTPSRVGLLTEVFRQREGVQRSLHPTNSVSAWGRHAESLLENHELSPTPYGRDTPYGRLAERQNTYILMLETHIHSLLHHIQERVNFPNLFLPDRKALRIVDHRSQRRTVYTRVMTRRIPYFIAVPSLDVNRPDWVILHDFALVFPTGREAELRRGHHNFDGYPRIFQRRKILEKEGVLRSAELGRGEIGLLHVRGFVNRIEPELADLLKEFRIYYDSEEIASRNLTYF